jgi:tartrate dehydratase beta subunit/fumarate hydratase class I family protein
MTIYKLKTLISEEEIRKLRVNDILYISGTVVTARDQAHRRALEYFKKGKPLPVNLEGLAVFHCGPVMRTQGDRWIAIKNVKDVVWLDLGMPDAMWILEVDEFGPLLVAIDACGNNLFRDVAEQVEKNRQRIYRKLRL